MLYYSFINNSTDILLILLLIGLIIILIPKKKRKKHLYNISKSNLIIEKINQIEFNGQKLNYLRKIDPFVFEELILTAFEKKGYRIRRNKKYTGDGGMDGIIFDQNNIKYIIQAKRYSNYINLAHLKEFEKLILQKKCKGYFVHTGKTGKASKTFTNKSNLEIISGDKLINLIS